MERDERWSDEEYASLLRQTASYYAEKLREGGVGARGMDWRDRKSQYLRFDRLLAQLAAMPGASLLDVGCGSGELLAYCRETGWQPDYLGIDVSEEMVAASNRRFGKGTATTATVADLARRDRTFDFVLASGTFNVRQSTPEDTWRSYFHRSVVEMFEVCHQAVAFNVMSTQVEYRHDHLFYADIEEVAKLVRLCGTRSYVIDHSYPLFEMTVTLNKQAGAVG